MKRDIKTVLHALGVSRSYQGYAYFIEAVRMAAEDPCRLTRVREKIYLPIARRNHTTIFNVEKTYILTGGIPVRAACDDTRLGNERFRGSGAAVRRF